MGWLHGTVAKAELPGQITVDPFGIARPNLEGVLYPDARYGSYAREGYGRNELVYACIMEKARTLPQAVLRVYSQNRDRNEPLEDHRLRRMLAQPNPVTTEVEFLQLTVVHLDLAGNAYWLINRARDGAPAELWPIRPDLVRIIPNPANPRDWSYGYVVEASATPQSIAIIRVPRSDVVHIKYPNPLDQFFGQAPLRPATRAVAVDNARTDYVDALLRNDAVPRVVVTTQNVIDDEVVSMLEDRWMRRHGGANRGKPAFLQAGMTAQPLGLNLRDLEFGDLSGTTEARICSAMGVQPILVGAKVGLDRSTFANFREAKVNMWESTLMDLQGLIRSAVQAKLVPAFTGVGRERIVTDWDKSQVLALQEAESEKWERATNALARGGITLNHFLGIVGLDTVPGGDVFLIPAGVVPVSAAGRIAPGDTPEQPAEEEVSTPELRAAAYVQEIVASTNGHRPPATVVAK